MAQAARKLETMWPAAVRAQHKGAVQRQLASYFLKVAQ